MSEETTNEWRGSLPEELRGAAFFKDETKTLEQLVTDLGNASAHMGNSIRIPGPDATDEQVAEFHARAAEKLPKLMLVPEAGSEDYTAALRKLGLPEAADKYTVPENCPIQGETMAEFMADAFSAGLTQTQFKQILDKQATRITTETENLSASRDAKRQALEKEWGMATDERLGAVEHLLKADEALAPIAAMIPDLDAGAVQWLFSVAELMGEKGQGSRQADGSSSADTPGELRAQANEIADRLRGMNEASNPQLYRQLTQKRIRLIEKAQKMS